MKKILDRSVGYTHILITGAWLLYIIIVVCPDQNYYA
jgi:hypothetical protein